MRVLLTPLAQTTHFHQMVGIIWALRAAGHEVRVAAQPPLMGAIMQTGTIAVSVGGGYDMMAGIADMVRAGRTLPPGTNADGSPRPSSPEALAERMRVRMVPHINAAADMTPDLADFSAAWRPDVVISDPLVYAAPIAASIAGAPLIRSLWGPDMSRHIALPGTGVSPEQDPRAAWPDELVAIYERYGTVPRTDLAVATLDTCPAALQLPGVPNRIPVRYTPVNGAAVQPPWTLERPDRPRVCVTWGSSSTALVGPDAFLVPRILEAVDGLDAEIVVAIRSTDRGRIPDVPDGVRIVEDLPLDLLLPTCSVVVHQSGAGTTLTAAYYGVAQVLLPQVADQPLVGARVAATGAGVVLSVAESTVDAIRRAVDAVRTEPYALAATALRDEMLAQPSAGEVVPLIETLAAGGADAAPAVAGLVATA